MPIETNDLDGGIGVLIYGVGAITNEEYLESFKNHLTQSREKLERYLYTLSDFTSATEVNVSSESISLVVSWCKDVAKYNRHVIVATVAHDDLIYGLARMSQMLMEQTGWQHEVFRNREDAVTWIRKSVEARFGIDNLTMA